eukprot:403340066
MWGRSNTQTPVFGGGNSGWPNNNNNNNNNNNGNNGGGNGWNQTSTSTGLKQTTLSFGQNNNNNNSYRPNAPWGQNNNNNSQGTWGNNQNNNNNNFNSNNSTNKWGTVSPSKQFGINNNNNQSNNMNSGWPSNNNNQSTFGQQNTNQWGQNNNNNQQQQQSPWGQQNNNNNQGGNAWGNNSNTNSNTGFNKSFGMNTNTTPTFGNNNSNFGFRPATSTSGFGQNSGSGFGQNNNSGFRPMQGFANTSNNNTGFMNNQSQSQIRFAQPNTSSTFQGGFGGQSNQNNNGSGFNYQNQNIQQQLMQELRNLPSSMHIPDLYTKECLDELTQFKESFISYTESNEFLSKMKAEQLKNEDHKRRIEGGKFGDSSYIYKQGKSGLLQHAPSVSTLLEINNPLKEKAINALQPRNVNLFKQLAKEIQSQKVLIEESQKLAIENETLKNDRLGILEKARLRTNQATLRSQFVFDEICKNEQQDALIVNFIEPQYEALQQVRQIATHCSQANGQRYQSQSKQELTEILHSVSSNQCKTMLEVLHFRSLAQQEVVNENQIVIAEAQLQRNGVDLDFGQDIVPEANRYKQYVSTLEEINRNEQLLGYKMQQHSAELAALKDSLVKFLFQNFKKKKNLNGGFDTQVTQKYISDDFEEQKRKYIYETKRNAVGSLNLIINGTRNYGNKRSNSNDEGRYKQQKSLGRGFDEMNLGDNVDNDLSQLGVRKRKIDDTNYYNDRTFNQGYDRQASRYDGLKIYNENKDRLNMQRQDQRGRQLLERSTSLDRRYEGNYQQQSSRNGGGYEDANSRVIRTNNAGPSNQNTSRQLDRYRSNIGAAPVGQTSALQQNSNRMNQSAIGGGSGFGNRRTDFTGLRGQTGARGGNK